MEAAEAHAHEQVEIIDRAAGEASSAAQLIERYAALGRFVAFGVGRAAARVLADAAIVSPKTASHIRS